MKKGSQNILKIFFYPQNISQYLINVLNNVLN